MEVKSALQVYQDFCDDGNAASLSDYLGELDEWKEPSYLKRARDLRHAATAEAAWRAFQQPGIWFGRDNIGRVCFHELGGEFQVLDPIGTVTWFDIDLPDAIKTVAGLLALIWEEWE